MHGHYFDTFKCNVEKCVFCEAALKRYLLWKAIQMNVSGIECTCSLASVHQEDPVSHLKFLHSGCTSAHSEHGNYGCFCF